MEVIFPFAIIFTKSEKPLFFIEVSDIIKKTGCSKNKCFWNKGGKEIGFLVILCG